MPCKVKTSGPCRPATADLSNAFFNMDCIEGCRRHIPDDSIDLIITDPPYGIRGDTLHRHYNRRESFVIDGYVEVPAAQYGEFSRKWIAQAERVLKPGGSIYIVSGYTNLLDILSALKATRLQERNHIVWKYNFGVYTRRKYVSSHYHILYCVKPGGRPTFNTFCRYGAGESPGEGGGSLNYLDREDVWRINREYKPGQQKNKNELPAQLLIKMLQYSSREGDLVCDLFLGSFSTAKIALGLNRRACGFELSANAFEYQRRQVAQIQPGSLLPTLRLPRHTEPANRGRSWSELDKRRLQLRFGELLAEHGTRKRVMEILARETGRGRFSLARMLALLQKADGSP